MVVSVPPAVRRRRAVSVAVVVGQTIEYYDFLLYGSAAALVFGPLFFPSTDARASTAAAFATFAMGFVMRPVGAIVFGHLGDRIGRRQTLIATLVLMGVTTTLIGALPTHEEAGALAAVLLVTLRCLQGLSMGGEWGGAALLAVEHSPAGRRAFYGALPQIGAPIGLLLSTSALLAVGRLPDDAFRAWGWRLPFLFTAVLMIVGLVARLRVEESPEFDVARRQRAIARTPVVEVWRVAWRGVLFGLLAATVTTAGYYLVNTFTISYVVNELGLSKDVGLIGQLVTGAVQAALIPVFGLWAINRPPRVLATGAALLVAVWAFPLYGLMQTGAAPAVWVGQAVATVFLTGVWALLPSLLAAQFPVHVRYTGISLCLQGASIFGGLAPLTATYVLRRTDGSPWVIATLLCAIALLSAWGAARCCKAVADEPASEPPSIPQQRRPTTAAVVQEA